MVDSLSETLLEPTLNIQDPEQTHEKNPYLGYWFGHLSLPYRLLQMAAMVGLYTLALILRLLKAYWEIIPDSLDDIRLDLFLFL